MVYRVGKMVLQKTQDVFLGKVNDVIVCHDISNGGNIYYTVIVVHDRKIAKQLMNLFHAEAEAQKNKFVTDFTWKDSYFMVFEYVKERALDRFFTAEIFTLNECEQMGLSLITECLACGIPYPVLYLQLKQRQINISPQKSVYLGYCIDLEEFSEKINQKDCAALCAGIIFDFIKEMNSEKAASFKLLEKKLWKGSYLQFTDLYKDLKMASQSLEKEGMWDRIKKFLKQNRDRIFRLLAIFCIVLGMIVFVMIISQVFFADIPFLKLFINPFEQIGTESLLQ